MNSISTPRLVVAVAAVLLAAPGAFAADVNEATEKAMKAASAKVAPTVVKIETAGGAEVIPVGKKGAGGGGIRKGVGPTTGLVVAADGYVITSSFNFAHKPTDIFVTIPGKPTRLVAKVVAHDQTRMLTLLKVDAKDLPVPTAFPKKDLEIGLWAIALGRTSDPDTDRPPSMSIGIVSAVNRIWGKAIQTDAKTSPVNYGGPLVAIDGRVFGVIVPMSNRAEGETAGVDVYDSGIGFAVPLEEIMSVVPRLKQGQDLRRGLLGITPQGTDVYNAEPVIGAIQPDSAAARAGLQVGDKILEINGKKIPNYSTLQHVLGPMYDGDEISLTVMRGDKEMAFKGVKLLGTATSYVNAFLGLLPMRDDPGPGVEIRYVYPKSPADTAGLKAGDRVMKIGRSAAGAPKGPKGPALAPIQNRAAFLAAMQQLTPGTEITLEVKRKEKAGDKEEEKTLTVTAKLVAAPADLPDKLPIPSSAGRALEGQPKKKDVKDPFPPEEDEAAEGTCGQDKKDEPKKDDKPKVETGLLKRANEALGREYWVYVPDNYDANKSYGLIVWFHTAGQGGKDAEKMAKVFREVCEDYNFIVVGPKSGNNDGWVPSETELVMQDVKTVLGQYTIDRTRVVAHGMGVGGQMAFYVAFNARDVFRGVATVGAVLGTNPKENVANQPLSFFIAGGDKDPLIKDITESKNLLLEKRFPVFFREMKESGKEYFDAPTFTDFLAWIDSLDRL
jgi:S1-C subfamily serine protease/dienelactone hydrolase